MFSRKPLIHGRNKRRHRLNPLTNCRSLVAENLEERLLLTAAGDIEWIQQFDGLSQAVDANGDVYVAGRSPASLKKFDANGTELWSRSIATTQSPSSNEVYAVAIGDTGVYVGGDTAFTLPGQTAVGGWDAFVRKYDFAGNEVWTRQFGTAKVAGVGGADRVTGISYHSSAIYVTGFVGPDALPGQVAGGSGDSFVRKYDANGIELWTDQFGGAGDEKATSISVSNSGAYVAGGITNGSALPGQSSAGADDAYVRAYGLGGTHLWTQQFGTTAADNVFGIAADTSSVIVAGVTSGALPGQTSLGDSDAFVRKFDPNGAVVWTNQFGTPSFDAALDLSLDPSGVYVGGLTSGAFPGESNFGGYDAFVQKFDSNGFGLWSSQFGSSAEDRIQGISADAAQVYASGYTLGTLPGQTSYSAIDGFAVALNNQLPCNLTVTTTANSGAGSLRDAIDCANSLAGPDTISFVVSGAINILGALPILSDSTGGTTIDGTTAPGYSGVPVVVVRGPGTGSFAGISINSADNVVRGLQLDSFARGVEITGSAATGNVVAGNYIGTDGTIAIPNFRGVQVIDATNNRIGTDGDGVNDASERNVISGNLFEAILVSGLTSSGTVIAGNLVGTDATGTVSVANGGDAIRITSAPNSRVGTDGNGIGDIAERNVISGNASRGVVVTGVNTVIAGNYVGVDVTGTVALGNANDGVFLQSDDNRVGTDGDGIADADEGNVVSANGRHGIFVSRSRNIVAGNYVGVDATGTTALGNSNHGVSVGWFDNRIGTDGDGVADLAERNIISGNGSAGVGIISSADRTIVAGNFIGTDVTGTVAIGNLSGVAGGMSTRIGTDGNGIADAMEGNLISGNTTTGVSINNLDGSIVAGNLIGTDVTGTVDLGNGGTGIQVGGGFATLAGAFIGTNSDGTSDNLERNVVSGNDGTGIRLQGSGISTTGAVVAGNLIGVDISGTAPLGNSGDGVEISNDSNHLIGGTPAGAANTIAFNAGTGVVVSGNSSTGNQISRNAIFSNSEIGIDLRPFSTSTGVTPNDLGDGDNGGNNLQNFPVLTSTTSDGVSTQKSRAH